MRISVTDRCNLRCSYCMPDRFVSVPQRELLTCEEIERVCRIAVRLGITRFKLTGGEPLVRPDIAELVGRVKRIPGVSQVTMTTNGVLLGEVWEALVAAGLDAVNISLDATDRALYEKITGFDGLPQVLSAIDLATTDVALRINAVLQPVNDREWEPLTELARERELDVRFIEMMPIGEGRALSGVSNVELLSRMREKYPSIRPDMRTHGNGPAVYYRIDGFAGAVGFISAMHGKFCDSCNRIRMTAIGELKPCLCYEDCVSIRNLLRSEEKAETDEAILAAMKSVIAGKPSMHCFEEQSRVTESRRMVQIGG